MKDDPCRVYEGMVKHMQASIKPVTLDQIAWLRDESLLMEELMDSRNRNALSSAEITPESLSDWTQFLSTSELKNYKAYLEHLGMANTAKEERAFRAVAISQNPEHVCMAGSPTTLPTFTKESTRRVMLTSLDRWLTAVEKMAITGFPVHQDKCVFVYIYIEVYKSIGLQALLFDLT